MVERESRLALVGLFDLEPLVANAAVKSGKTAAYQIQFMNVFRLDIRYVSRYVIAFKIR